MAIGNGFKGKGGTAMVYRSKSLTEGAPADCCRSPRCLLCSSSLASQDAWMMKVVIGLSGLQVAL